MARTTIEHQKVPGNTCNYLIQWSTGPCFFDWCQLNDFFIRIGLYCCDASYFCCRYPYKSLFLMCVQKSISFFAVCHQFRHKWMVMPEYTTQRVPGDLSRCRASHLSLNLITPIHFTGLTCICCVWNKIHTYSSYCYFLLYRGMIRRPSFLVNSWVKQCWYLSGLVLSLRLLLFWSLLLMNICMIATDDC